MISTSQKRGSSSNFFLLRLSIALSMLMILSSSSSNSLVDAQQEDAANGGKYIPTTTKDEVDPDDFGTGMWRKCLLLLLSSFSSRPHISFTLSSLTTILAFMASFLMIVVSEIGDKTFFIAAVMAMKNARLTVFIGAISALGLMTILSTALGYAVPNLISRSYTRILAILLFGFFGIKMLWDAYKMDKDESELEEVTNELETKERERAEDTMEGGGKVSSPVDRKRVSSSSSGLVSSLLSLLLLCFLTPFTFTSVF
jgi:putative Ca2+/H+ antiporter (TMEM165/GDT1 family)